jgi:serine/threonine protein kinase
MSSMDLPEGTILTKGKHPYKILGTIGQGGFAIAYRAINMTTSEIVAIKEKNQCR